MAAGWEEQARCREIGLDAFFSDEKGAHAVYASAKQVCGFCPVRMQCLDRAMEAEAGSNDSYRAGVWGGLTPAERYARYRRERGPAGLGAAA